MFNFSHKYFERMFDSGFIPVLTNNLVDCTYTLTLRSTSPRHADWKKSHREARVFFEQMATHCLNYKIPCHNPLAFFHTIYERREQLQHPDAFSDIRELLFHVIAGGQTCFGTIMDEPGHVRENMRICDFVLFSNTLPSVGPSHSLDDQIDASNPQSPRPADNNFAESSSSQASCPDDDEHADEEYVCVTLSELVYIHAKILETMQLPDNKQSFKMLFKSLSDYSELIPAWYDALKSDDSQGFSFTDQQFQSLLQIYKTYCMLQVSKPEQKKKQQQKLKPVLDNLRIISALYTFKQALLDDADLATHLEPFRKFLLKNKTIILSLCSQKDVFSLDTKQLFQPRSSISKNTLLETESDLLTQVTLHPYYIALECILHELSNPCIQAIAPLYLLNVLKNHANPEAPFRKSSNEYKVTEALWQVSTGVRSQARNAIRLQQYNSALYNDLCEFCRKVFPTSYQYDFCDYLYDRSNPYADIDVTLAHKTASSETVSLPQKQHRFCAEIHDALRDSMHFHALSFPQYAYSFTTDIEYYTFKNFPQNSRDCHILSQLKKWKTSDECAQFTERYLNEFILAPEGFGLSIHTLDWHKRLAQFLDTVINSSPEFRAYVLPHDIDPTSIMVPETRMSYAEFSSIRKGPTVSIQNYMPNLAQLQVALQEIFWENAVKLILPKALDVYKIFFFN